MHTHIFVIGESSDIIELNDMCCIGKSSDIINNHIYIYWLVVIYPLVNVYITNWKDPPCWSSVNHLFLWAIKLHGNVSPESSPISNEDECRPQEPPAKAAGSGDSGAAGGGDFSRNGGWNTVKNRGFNGCFMDRFSMDFSMFFLYQWILVFLWRF